MSDTNFLENEILKLKLGKPLSLTLPITPYLGLFTVTAAEDGTGFTEVSFTGTGYSRKAISGLFPTPNGTGSVANSSAIDFGTATAGWGNIPNFGIFTAATGGTLLTIGDVSPAITVANTQPVSFPVGALVLNQD